MRPVDAHVIAGAGYVDKASRDHLRSGKVIYPETLRILIDVAAKNVVTFAQLIVHPAGSLVVVERSCDGAPCGSKLDWLPQHIDRRRGSEGEIATGNAGRTNGGQRADRGVIGKGLLQLIDSVRRRGEEGSRGRGRRAGAGVLEVTRTEEP